MLAVLSACKVDVTPGPAVSDMVMIEAPAESESTSPNLAVGPDGTAVLSWLEPDGSDYTLKFSTLNDNV